MTPHQWQQISLLFAQCLEIAPAGRVRLLAEYGATEEIRLEVERLLKSFDDADSDIARQSPGDSSADHRLKDGELLSNRFRIVRFVQRGGMGEVYEADDLNVGVRIALKIVRSSHQDIPGVSARLKRELLLARSIAHPNVCRLSI